MSLLEISVYSGCLLLFTPVGKWTWEKLFVLFTIMNGADFLSTILYIHGHPNGNWAHEKNSIVQLIGPVFGFLLTALSLKIIFVVGIYIIYRRVSFLQGFPGRFYLLMSISTFFWVTVGNFKALFFP